ncbi:putative reverse transcriptase domain-containing protein [Tanacetum coccineum]|uniref:Reverse transcriptase domain-containing protein n=1 Tax=Tanacetum coccineum TaxID=301880 RepID=A0ABQ5I0B5_9ASTR
MVSMTRFLELLHMDLFDPSAIQSYGGNRYSLVIVDDYSRTYHGQEFDNEVQFGVYCDSNGITYNFSAPRTPQSNRNKAILVAQGYNQQEGIYYDETFTSVARLDSINILFAYACAYDFKLYQMDVKSAFLNGFINEEIIMVNVIPPDYVDGVPVVEPKQHDDVHVVPDPVLVDEDEDPEEEEFEEEEEPQEEEDDMEVDIEEDENELDFTYPYKEVDPLNPLPPVSESEPEDAIEVENPIEHKDETVPASVYKVGELSTATFLHEDSDGLLHGLMRRDIVGIKSFLMLFES